MNMKKAELLEQAALLGLNVDPKSKLVDIKQAISEAEGQNQEARVTNHEEVAEDAAGTAPQDSKLQTLDSAEPEAQLAKAGKRSKKALEEAEERQAKEERKAKADQGANDAGSDEEHALKRGPKPKTRTLLERKGKKYREAAKAIDRSRMYSLDEACKLAQSTSTTKFDATVEVHINLGVDPTQADQNVRGTLVLPHGTGKTLRVAVFGSDDDVKSAKDAGADKAASDSFLEDLKKGLFDFDVLIATPDVMAKLGQFAKVLGPKGLMPNPKSGTVTKNVAQAVKDAKAGRVEYRVDKQGIVHAGVGKVSFKPEALLANANALVKAVQDARPPSIKGVYMKSATVTTSMGPSIHLDLKSL
jgi:large subunit ribosomal protein L1